MKFFFCIFLFFSIFFCKNIYMSWLYMEILTSLCIFITLSGSMSYYTLKNLFKFFVVQAWVGVLLIFFFFFYWNPYLFFLLLSVKMSSFPSHVWVPDLMSNMSTFSFFFLLSAPKIYPMFFFFFFIFNDINMIKMISLLTIMVGGVGVFFSNNFKMFFLFSSISQMSWFFLCLSLSSMTVFFFFSLYLIMLFYFYKLMKNNDLKKGGVSMLDTMVWIMYSGLPFSIPLYMKYIVTTPYSFMYIYFFLFFIIYYLFFFTFTRYIWSKMHYLYLFKKNSLYSIFIVFSPVLFFLF